MANLTEHEYVQAGGMVCPVCRTHGQLEAHRPTADGDFIYMDIYCAACGETYTEHYVLTGYDHEEGA